MIRPRLDGEHDLHLEEHLFHFVTCGACYLLLESARESDDLPHYWKEGMNNLELVKAYLRYREDLERAREWEAGERKRGSLPDTLSDEEVLERYHYHYMKMGES